MGVGLDPATRAASSARTRDHLANERTFLAWMRTALGLIGLGFVVARLGLFLHEMVLPRPEPVESRGGEFIAAGLVLLGCGVLLSLWGGYVYGRGRLGIERQTYEPAHHSIFLVTLLVALAGAGLAVLVVWRMLSP